MESTFKIFLKAKERFFINGAVFRVDRKVAIELLNDVHFLLESHVLQAEDAVTPLRQLYYVIQIMVLSPKERDTVMVLFRESLANLLTHFENRRVITDLKHVDQLVGEERYYDALKIIRNLYPIEAEIMRAKPADTVSAGTGDKYMGATA